MDKTKFNEMLKKCDEINAIWDKIPKNPSTWDDDEVDWTENDWTVDNSVVEFSF